MDFYFLTALINMLWQIFAVLFLLYRFTSFFSMIYNFTFFLRKILKGVLYVKDQASLYIIRKKGYSYRSNDETNERHNRLTTKSPVTKIKNWIFRKFKTPHIPLYETRTSYINMNMSSDFTEKQRHLETLTHTPKNDRDFENHMNNMMNSNYESSQFYDRNLKRSTYLPISHRRTQSQPSLNPAVSITSENLNNDNDNILFNSQFLTKILHPFSHESENETEDELKKALLNSDYNHV